MKKIYIHIGCHKTGSTSIQHFFFKNKNILLKNNIYIPKQKNPFDYTINHSDIAMELLKENTIKKKYIKINYFKNFLNEIKKQRKDILITSENFSFLIKYPKKIKKLVKDLKKIKYQPIFICYIRNDNSYAFSLYSELRKNKQKIELDNIFKFTNKILNNGYYESTHSDWGYWTFYFDYKKFIRKWKNYSKCKIFVVDYSKNLENIFTPIIQLLKINKQKNKLKYPPIYFNKTNYKTWHIHKLFYRVYFYFSGKKIFKKYKF
tara:strand:+ start:12401 stop:13186 length:786 start_codon:yes stop_codon:yes gene_type:complete